MDAVNAVPTLSDPYRRRRVLDQLREEYPAEFESSAPASFDNWSIVDTCIQLGVVPELVSVLKFVGDESPQWRRLDELVTELFPTRPEPLVDDELDQRAKALLEPIPEDVVAAVVRHDLLREHEPVAPADPGTATDVYDRLRTHADPTLLLTYFELVCHQLDDHYTVVELHRLIDDLTLRSGVETAHVRDFCRALRGPASPSDETTSPHVTESPGTDVEDTEGGDVRSSDTQNLLAHQRQQRRPPVWGGMPPRNNNFTGRIELLQQIRDSLHLHNKSALVPQPLHGLGGIGKSQLAIEFAYLNQSDYDLVWWIQADDEQSVRRSLTSLAKRLDLAESTDVQENVDAVLDALRVGHPYENWLLLYDNAGEPSVVQPYLPSGPGHVLVTSRSRSWSGLPNALEVDVFTPEESIELLRRGWSGLTDDRALVLAEELGHLPLALEQAVAVHEQTGMPLQDYLRALESSPKIILDEGNPANYPRTVASALELAYTSIKDSSPAAAYLLELCAFLSSHPIAIPMLARGRIAQPMPELRDDILLRRAVRDLGRYALVQLDAGRDFIRVHALIRAVLRDSIPTDRRDTVEKAAHAVLAAANPGTPDDAITWSQHAQIAPHVQPAGLILSDEYDVRRVVLDQIRYHFAIGDYSTSRDLGEKTVKSWRARYGPDDELTLVAARHMANSMRLLGEYQAALELNEDTLDRMTKSLGEDHEHTLATASNYAADLRLAGKLRESFELDEVTLRRHRSVLGERDPATLRAISNLAASYRILGDFRSAYELDAQNIDLRRDMYGEDDTRTLLSYSRLMRDLYGLGQYQRGLALAREKMPVYEQKLPQSHHELLLAKRHMAILLRKAGHNSEALTAAKELHDACCRKFGSRHEHTLSAMVTLSNAYRVNGDTSAAITKGRAALDAYLEVLGPNHPFTLAAQVDLAIALRLGDRRDEARELNDVALETLTATLGEDNLNTLCAANTKANGLAADGHVEEARALGERTLELAKRVRGEHHPYTLACAVNLSFDLEKLGDLVTANRLRRETLDLLGVHLGTDHPETMNAGVYRRLESDIEVVST